jgi:arginyl-tRNA synthetase
MKKHIIDLIHTAITLKNPDIETPNIHVEQTKNPEHGHFSSNIALVLSKQFNMPPRDLARDLCALIPPSENITNIEVAGPGFINFYLEQTNQFKLIQEILDKKRSYGQHSFGENQSVQVEFVSANPTGPLHVGHGRGAAYGDCIAKIMEACGYNVQKEYYVNDAGRQMDILATSIYIRYLQIYDPSIIFPSNGYKGQYIYDYAQQLSSQYNKKFIVKLDQLMHNTSNKEHDEENKEEHIDILISNAKQLLGLNYEIVFNYGLNTITEEIKEDLQFFNINFDQWFSEKSLVRDIDSIIDKLAKKSLIEKRDGALWFLSQQLGDDKDRVIKRSNGQYTYFASDIAYHYNKFNRGFNKVINVWGADHHGYIARIKCALQALDIDPKNLEIKLVQLVSLYRGSELISMSTRSGEFVTLRNLVEEVGCDGARLFYVMNKLEQPSNFDLELAKSKSHDNPVYYIQYAHARICSVMDKYKQQTPLTHQVNIDQLSLLSEESEIELLKLLYNYPDVVKKSGLNGEPHLVVNYLRKLASQFHSYYNSQKVITDNLPLTQARITFYLAIKQVLSNGLDILGLSQPENM